MTNRTRFFYNGMLLTAVGLALRTVGLFFGAYISRAVGAEGVGLHSLVMTVYTFAVTFATSGISLTVTKLVAEAVAKSDGDGGRGVLRAAVGYSLLFGSASTLFLFFAADSLAEAVLVGRESARALRILSLSLIPTALSSVFSGYFVGVKRVACNAVVQVFSQAFKIVFTVAVVSQLSSMGAVHAVTLLCIGTALSEILCFLIVLFEFFVDRAKSKRAAKYKKGEKQTSAVFGMALPLAFSAYIRSALLTLEHSLIPKRLRRSGKSESEALSSYGFLHGMALPLCLYPMAPLSSFSGLLVPEFSAAKASSDSVRMERIASEAINTTLIYSIVSAVVLYIFSEELGYAIYGSYDAGRYIAILAPVVPIMYLDHVTDSILKGIGEHVYSMWVNIADAFVSVILVWLLIPVMGIGGYAVVIIGMELFNFTFSAIRLRKRISFKINWTASLLIPLFSCAVSAFLSRELFVIASSNVTAGLLIAKIVFALCACFVIYKPLSCLAKAK